MRLPRSIVVVALVALLAGCGETFGPIARPLLPGRLADSLGTLTSLVQTETFLSFRILGPLSAVPGSSPTAPIFPDSMLRRIFHWDAGAHEYASAPQDTMGGPASGTRFLLYTPDTMAGRPIEPPQQLGTADLLDISIPDTTRLHVRATGGNPMVTIDYTVRGQFAPESLSAFFGGCVSDALGLSACLTGTVVQRPQNADTLVSVGGTGIVAGQILTYAVAIDLGASEIVQGMDIVIDEPDIGETVRLFGTLAVQGSTPTASIGVTVNGLPFATISGQGTLTIRGPNNQPLSEAEHALLIVLFELPGRLLDTGRALARPGQRNLGG